MGAFSIWHWVIVLIVVLILFGGKGKLSSIMGDFGKGLKNFKDQVNQSEISNLRSEISKIENSSTYNSEIDEIKGVENELNMKSLKKDLNEINNLSSNKMKKNK